MLIADIFNFKDIEAKLKKLQLPYPFYNAAEYIKSLPVGNSGVKIIVQKYKIADSELQAIKNSLSFKLGRMITFIPRKMRNVLKRKR